MRKFLCAVIFGALFVSAVPVFADGNPDDLFAVQADSSVPTGGNPTDITESDSVEQSETNNSVLQYSLSVPADFDVLKAGDATLYVFNEDTSVLIKMVLPEKNGYQATGYFPAGDNYLISGMMFANTDIQSPFSVPDPGFTLSPDQPFVFTSAPTDDSIEKSIEVQKKVVVMQQDVKADKERLISEGVMSRSGRDLSIHQEAVASSDFDYEPIAANSSQANVKEENQKHVSSPFVKKAIVVLIGSGIVVLCIALLRKKKKQM